jgi:BNR repeat protein
MIVESIRRETLIPSPSPGAGVSGALYYTRTSGSEMFCMYSMQTRSDLCDGAYTMLSTDNGRTWSESEFHAAEIVSADGILRRSPRVAVVDPHTDRFVWFFTEGLFDGDDPLQGMLRYQLRYRVSSDGGRTWDTDELMIQEGEEYDAPHPFPNVWIGRNSMMLGDQTCVPIVLPDGSLLVPTQVAPLGPDGVYHRPGGGFTYHDTAIVSGTWRDDFTIAWKLAGVVEGNPQRSTRGALEPTLAELDGGRMLVVMRGSNDVKPHLPGHRWFSIREEQRNTWSPAQPWTYTDGEPFHSPSSCSQLLPHSSGRLLWIGNLCGQNPQGNRPRHPLVVAEVDTRTGLVMRDSVTILDDRAPGESEQLTLSNFHALEDRESGEILVTLPRYYAHAPVDGAADFTADLSLIRCRLI